MSNMQFFDYMFIDRFIIMGPMVFIWFILMYFLNAKKHLFTIKPSLSLKIALIISAMPFIFIGIAIGVFYYSGQFCSKTPTIIVGSEVIQQGEFYCDRIGNIVSAIKCESPRDTFLFIIDMILGVIFMLLIYSIILTIIIRIKNLLYAQPDSIQSTSAPPVG